MDFEAILTHKFHEATLTEGEAEADFVRHLRVLAGVDGESSRFVLQRDGVAVQVQYSSGSGSNVKLAVEMPRAPRAGAPRPTETGPSARGGYRHADARDLVAIRPLKIELRREQGDDVDAKSSGVAREFHTGDGDFDAEVYIDTPTDDAALRAVLAAQPLRDGVRKLLDLGIPRIVIDDDAGEITFTVLVFASLVPEPDRVSAMVDAFFDVVRNVPFVAACPDARPWTLGGVYLGLGSMVTGAIALGSIPMYLRWAPRRCFVSTSDGTQLRCGEPTCCSPPPIGLAWGFPIAMALAMVLTRRYRGTSRSHSDRKWAFVVTTVLTLEIAVIVTALWMWR